MRVLVACEFSGIVRDAFLARGHEAWSCDLLPSESPLSTPTTSSPKGAQRWHIRGEVLSAIPTNNWDLMIAHPPCTDLSVSGARWFPAKQHFGLQQDAIEFFMALVNADIPRIAVENPISIMSTRYRQPDQIVQPHRFGHAESKATCLWLKGLPLLHPTKIIEPPYTARVHREPPSPDRWKNRSRTYQGIADAMASQWG